MSVNTPGEALRVQIATHTAASPIGTEVTPSQSDLTDALEEIGMSVATRGSKSDVEKMKLRRGQGSNFAALGRIADHTTSCPRCPPTRSGAT